MLYIEEPVLGMVDVTQLVYKLLLQVRYRGWL